jgi:hypothetical protein
MHHHDCPVQRPHQRNRDKPAQDRQACGWGFNGGVTHEAKKALIVGVVKAVEDNLLQILSEFVSNAFGTARAWLAALFERTLSSGTSSSPQSFSRGFFNAYDWARNSTRHFSSFPHAYIPAGQANPTIIRAI